MCGPCDCPWLGGYDYDTGRGQVQYEEETWDLRSHTSLEAAMACFEERTLAHVEDSGSLVSEHIRLLDNIQDLRLHLLQEEYGQHITLLGRTM